MIDPILVVAAMFGTSVGTLVLISLLRTVEAKRNPVH